MALFHQARLNGVVLLKIDGAVLEILMKNHFVLNMFFLISQERLHQFSSLRCLLKGLINAVSQDINEKVFIINVF